METQSLTATGRENENKTVMGGTVGLAGEGEKEFWGW